VESEAEPEPEAPVEVEAEEVVEEVPVEAVVADAAPVEDGGATAPVVVEPVLPNVDRSSEAGASSVRGLLKGLLLRPGEFAGAVAQFAAPGFAVDQTAEAVRAVLQSDGFNQRIDQMREGIEQATTFNQAVVGSSVAVTTGLSVGYVAWLVRGGVLLSTALSSLPAWQFIDPLPVLARTRDEEEDAHDDSLQNIIKEESKRADSRNSDDETDTEQAEDERPAPVG
jgi:hypothetical protein